MHRQGRGFPNPRRHSRTTRRSIVGLTTIPVKNRLQTPLPKQHEDEFVAAYCCRYYSVTRETVLSINKESTTKTGQSSHVLRGNRSPARGLDFDVTLKFSRSGLYSCRRQVLWTQQQLQQVESSLSPSALHSRLAIGAVYDTRGSSTRKRSRRLNGTCVSN